MGRKNGVYYLMREIRRDECWPDQSFGRSITIKLVFRLDMSSAIIYVPGQGFIKEMFGKTYTHSILGASEFDPLQIMFCERRVLIPSTVSKL